MGIMNDKLTVKEHCEAWGRKHGVIVTADQYVEQLKAENDYLRLLLGRYGRHDPGCTPKENDCSCGFEQTVESLKE